MEHPDKLEERTRGFAQEIDDLMDGIGITGAELDVRIRGKAIVIAFPEGGVELRSEDSVVLNLHGRFQCEWDSSGEFLAVRDSTFKVTTPNVTEPLFHYDFSHSSAPSVPAAHINVHAHRDELIYALLTAGHSGRGKIRRKAMEAKGTVSKLSDLHFTLGGSRFRPCRELWRDRQLASAVRDNPTCAAQTLENLGFSVVYPREEPSLRQEKTQEY